MAHFEVRIESDLPATVSWQRVLDLRAHSEVIPLTTVSGDTLYAAGLAPGSTFIARTAVGPLGFDDPMVFDDIVAPETDSPGRARIRKDGSAVRGSIQLVVTPRGSGSTVSWSQEIGVRGVPGALDAVVAKVARAAYGSILRKLLDRG